MRKGPKPRPWQDRFTEKIDIRGDDECWPWLAGKMKNGYGRFGKSAGDIWFAHRLAYVLWVGPIPKGLDIDHVCHNGSGCPGGVCEHRSCCNPKHLRAVTRRENSIAGEGPAGRARSKVCRRGHEYTPENTIRHHGRRECRKCENAYQRERRKNRSKT